MSAHEENGKVTFLHKIKDGSVDKSYGIHVAKLANLPENLIKRASDIFSIYESKEKRYKNTIVTPFRFGNAKKRNWYREKIKINRSYEYNSD